MKIFLATNNLKKIKEIKRILGDLKIKLLTPKDLGIKFSVKEDGSSFYENAYKKAISGLNATGHISLGEDSGLLIEYLGNAPGVNSRYFAGKKGDDEANIRKVLKLLKKVDGEARKAKFKCVIALALSYRKVRFFSGECLGYIAKKKMGRSGFGYDPIFIPLGYEKTFAQLGMKKKNELSHRAQALYQLKKYLKDEFGPLPGTDLE